MKRGNFYEKDFIIFHTIFLTIHKIDAFEKPSDEIIDMATIVVENDLEVHEWQVVFKDQIKKETLEKLLINFKQNQYTIEQTEDEQMIKYVVTNSKKSGKVFDEYNVVISKENENSIEFISILNGDSWNKKIKKEYELKKTDVLDKYVSQSPMIYACLTTKKDAIIKSDYFLSVLAETLHFQSIETQVDTITYSMVDKIFYGYTPRWKRKLTVENKEINFQLVVKTDKFENTTFMIGTPILINEY